MSRDPYAPGSSSGAWEREFRASLPDDNTRYDDPVRASLDQLADWDIPQAYRQYLPQASAPAPFPAAPGAAPPAHQGQGSAFLSPFQPNHFNTSVPHPSFVTAPNSFPQQSLNVNQQHSQAHSPRVGQAGYDAFGFAPPQPLGVAAAAPMPPTFQPSPNRKWQMPPNYDLSLPSSGLTNSGRGHAGYKHSPVSPRTAPGQHQGQATSNHATPSRSTATPGRPAAPPSGPGQQTKVNTSPVAPRFGRPENRSPPKSRGQGVGSRQDRNDQSGHIGPKPKQRRSIVEESNGASGGRQDNGHDSHNGRHRLKPKRRHSETGETRSDSSGRQDSRHNSHDGRHDDGRHRSMPKRRKSSESQGSSRRPSQDDGRVSEQSRVDCLRLIEQLIAHFEISDRQPPSTYQAEVERRRQSEANMLMLRDACDSHSLESRPKEMMVLRTRVADLMLRDAHDLSSAETFIQQTLLRCNTYHFYDLECANQHLQIQVFATTNRLAANKLVQKMIARVESSKSLRWTLAFRLLKLRLALTAHPIDWNAVLNSNQQMRAVAKRKSAEMVYMTHLIDLMCTVRAKTPDSLQRSREAMASARALAAGTIGRKVPHLRLLQLFLEGASLLEPYDPKQLDELMRCSGQSMDGISKEIVWLEDGSFPLPFDDDPPDEDLRQSINIFDRTDRGGACMKLQWLGQDTAQYLTLMMKAAACQHKAPTQDRRSGAFLAEALRLMDLENKEKMAAIEKSSPAVGTKEHFFLELRMCLVVQAGHVAVARGDKDDAVEFASHGDQLVKCLKGDAARDLGAALAYIRGEICHMAGHPAEFSITYYASLIKHLETPPTNSGFQLLQFYGVLGALNAITRALDPQVPGHEKIPQWLDTIRHFLPDGHENPALLEDAPPAALNKHLSAALSFLMAVLPPKLTGKAGLNSAAWRTDSNSRSILDTKQCLTSSCEAAKKVSNVLIVTMCLNYMNSAFYEGIVGSKAVRAAHLANMTAEQAGVPPWPQFSSRVYKQTLARENGEQS